MKKYLIPATLIAVAALAAPAFADDVNITFEKQNGAASNTTLNWEVNSTYGYYVAANLSTDDYFTFEWGALTAVDSSGATITSPQIMNQQQNPLDLGTVIPYNTTDYTLSFTFTATQDIEISYIAFQFVGDRNGGSFDNAASDTSACAITLTTDEGTTTLFSDTVTLYGTSKSEVEGHTGTEYEADYLVIEFDTITLKEGDSITFTLGVTETDVSSLRTGLEGIDVGVRAVPEPSMFGLFFGLGAIGLVATRRRRRA